MQVIHHDFMVLLQVLKDHRRNDGLIGDYCDSSFIINHSYFQETPNALQLLMYYDEIEVYDPLASHIGVHKLGNVKIVLYIVCLPVLNA